MSTTDLGAMIALRSPDLQFVRQGRRDRARYVASDLRRGKHAALRLDVYRLLGEFDGRRTLAQIYAGGAVAIDVDNPRTLQVAEIILASRNSISDEANVRMSPIGARGCGLPVSLSSS